MPQNLNSASRLLAILKSIPGHAESTQILAVWSDLFSLQDQNINRLSMKVADRLAAMNRELDLVRDGMKKAGFSEALYANALNSFESALTPMLLPHTWNNARQQLSTENLLALGFCSEILPDEEVEITQSEIEDIQATIGELNTLLSDSKLPSRLTTLLAHHVDLMLIALAEYPISGAKALREAARTGLGELIEAKELVAEHKAATEVNKLGEAWKKFNNAADTALKAEKLLQLGHKAWELLSGVFQNGV